MNKLDNIYLSVIAASRNDNHGENLDQRTNIFIKSLAENCKKYQIKSELILVEWNQIPNTKTLSDRLDLVSNEYLNSKIITVNQLHLQLELLYLMIYLQQKLFYYFQLKLQ